MHQRIIKFSSNDEYVGESIRFFKDIFHQLKIKGSSVIFQFFPRKNHPGCTSLRAYPTVSVEMKFPVELNSFSGASRVCEPANESLLASENEFNSTGSFNSKGTVGDERRLGCTEMEIDDYAKDGGEELFTKMHCIRFTNL